MTRMITKIVLLMVMIGIGVSTSLSAATISLTAPLITPSPLDRVEDNGEGIASFGLAETINLAAPATDQFGNPNIRISVEFTKLKLKNGDVSNITGGLMNYFEATYDSANNIIIFTQTNEYPARGDESVSIAVEVTANALSTDNELNKFNANLSATDRDTLANGNASFETYTKDAPPTPVMIQM